MSESRDSKRRASLKRDFSVDKEDRRSFRGKLACLRHTFGKFQWPSRVQGRDDHRATVGSNGPCARVRFCVRVYVYMCSYDVRFDPLPRSRATSLTRLRPCTNFTLGTYGFPVLASCFLSGHANNTNYNALLFFASLSTRFSLFLAPPRPRFRLSVVPYTCGRAYLACIRVYVYARPLVRHCLTLPSSSLFRGICTVSHKRFTPVVVYKFFLPPVFTFSMHLSILLYLLSSLFVFSFFSIIILTLKF